MVYLEYLMYRTRKFMEYLEKYNEWLNNELFDNEIKSELLKIRENDGEIKAGMISGENGCYYENSTMLW